MPLSHFDEKSGVIPFKADWGQWYQTIDEIHIEINKYNNLKSRDVAIKVTASHIKCRVLNETILEGQLFRTVHPDEVVWTIEDGGSLLNLVLTKADYSKKEIIWESLLADGQYRPDPMTLIEMRKKIDLEHFQIEHPGFDFSSAKLKKSYDDRGP